MLAVVWVCADSLIEKDAAHVLEPVLAVVRVVVVVWRGVPALHPEHVQLKLNCQPEKFKAGGWFGVVCVCGEGGTRDGRTRGRDEGGEGHRVAPIPPHPPPTHPHPSATSFRV